MSALQSTTERAYVVQWKGPKDQTWQTSENQRDEIEAIMRMDAWAKSAIFKGHQMRILRIEVVRTETLVDETKPV